MGKNMFLHFGELKEEIKIKNLISSILLFFTLTMILLSGCGNTSSNKANNSENDYIKLDEGMVVNRKFDENSMKTITGNDFIVQGDESIFTDKEMGFGIKLTDTMLKYQKEDRLKIVDPLPYCVLFSVFTEQRMEILDSANSLSHGGYKKQPAEHGRSSFEQCGVFRYNKDEKYAEDSFEVWKSYFAEIEELCVYSDNTYYFGYNKDYSNTNTNQNDQE